MTKQRPVLPVADASPAAPAAAPRQRRTQAERSTQTRQKLLDAAIQLAHESGFSRLTINDVAKRAGLTSGAVQHHFFSSRELLRAVAEAVYPIFQLSLDETAHTKSLQRRLDQIIDIYWSMYRSPEYLVFWDLLFGTRGNAELREVLATMQKDVVARAVADLSRAFADIGLRRTAAFNLWTFVTSQMRGLALLAIFEDKRVLDDDLGFLKKAAFDLLKDQSKRTTGA
ncbi:TetR/AcrR family transcriptional regulator [Steroidobacter sp.]|uniref:TetR/AcrR family transcriptional regulator n=1 Tax=Steroidobacter sp. TaxID=1978227 RepID=UPI001A4E904F|nr:TetR/AcrR family transcriptional regulator [Steroidobacter sp.]MBL8265265.1 TetR/AcrR family transcriptional regulator [Steroidobacter sp.]